MASVSVWLDKENQVVEQRIEGMLTMELFDQLETLTQDCADRLDPGSDIRILIDARKMLNTNLATRKRGVAMFERHSIARMAFWGGSRLACIVQRLVMIVVGESRVGVFPEESEARKWLLQGRVPVRDRVGTADE